MAAVKRRNGNVKNETSIPKKKPKTNQGKIKNSKVRSEFKETETDSDPIVESDTTEHSGEDDGVSWPSADEEIRDPISPTSEESDADSHEDDDGGVKLPDEGPSRKENETKNASKTCMLL